MSLKSEFIKFTNRIKNNFKEKFPRLNADTGVIAPSANGSTADEKFSTAGKSSSDEAPMIGKLPFEEFSDDGKSSFAEVLNVGKSSFKENAPSASSASLNTNIGTSGGPVFGRFNDLPEEIRSMIGVRAVLANSEGLLAGVKTLRQVSRPLTNHVAADPMLDKIERVPQRAAALANYVHEKTYPKNGLPEHEFTDRDEGKPLYAVDHVRDALQKWDFLSEQKKSRVVQDVLNISNAHVAWACIRAFSQNSDILETTYGRPIVKKAIEIFGTRADTSENWRIRDEAQSIVRLGKHAGPEEISRLGEIFVEHRRYEKPFSEAMDAVEGARRIQPLNLKPLDRGKPLTLTQLNQIIDGHLEDNSISERARGDEIHSALFRIPDAIKGSIAELRPELSEIHVPGDINRSGSQARADISGTQRARSDHAR